MLLRRRWLVLSLLLTAVVGCATPRSEYGSHARYAPAYRGYVLGDTRGGEAEGPAHVLLNPLTGDKLQCESEVRSWLEVERDTVEDQVHDQNVQAVADSFVVVGAPLAAASIAFFLPTLPATILSTTGLLGVEVGLITELAGLSTPGDVMFEEAREHFGNRNWREAIRLYERALAKASWLRTGSLALYEVGVAYAEIGKNDRAREALHTFVTRAVIGDRDAYDNAERWQRWLDEPAHTCERDAVEVRWRNGD